MLIEAKQVKEALLSRADAEKAERMATYFRTGEGHYGEGDRFLGVTVPQQREVVRQAREISLTELTSLLKDEYHECRLTALLLLVDRYKRARAPEDKASLARYYWEHLDWVNNWDLVDASAYKILGEEVVRTGDSQPLDTLASSGELWRERVAVISTLALIKKKQFSPTLRLCKRFLTHPHDLIHKATGWMLRELGKVNRVELETFLARHAKKMPRTMLRYAIEKLPRSERERWLESSRV